MFCICNDHFVKQNINEKGYFCFLGIPLPEHLELTEFSINSYLYILSHIITKL